MQLCGRIDLTSLCSMLKSGIIECGSRFKHRERTMAYPTTYTSAVAIPLPSEQTVQQMFGKSYDPERTLNVLKMFAGTEDLCEATMGIVKAMFAAKGIDPKIREMIILRAAKVLNAPYEAQANVVMAKNAGLSAAESTLQPPMVQCLALSRNISWCAKRPMSCQMAEHCAMRLYENF
jgi:alkylhydroperoxidase/carboxymuconolactone decarboxylase family protein YurZ